MSDAKPVDLAAMRRRIKSKPWEGCLCNRIPHLEACPRHVLGNVLESKDDDIRTLIDEVDALREGIRWALEETDIEACGPCPNLRALLPPS